MITCLLFGDYKGNKPSTLHKFLNYIVQVSVSTDLLCYRDHLLRTNTCLSCQQAAENELQMTSCFFSHECVFGEPLVSRLPCSPFCRQKHTMLSPTTTHCSSKEELVVGADRPLHRSVLCSSISMAFISLLPSTSHLPPSCGTCGQPWSWILHLIPDLSYL